MSDEKKVSLEFLGEQMLRMQSDLRDVRAGYARVSEEQAGIRTDFTRLEAKVDRIDSKVDAHDVSNNARFEQLQQTMATNLEITLKIWESTRK